MSGSFVLENPFKVAFLGPAGSFSHAAGLAKFGRSVSYEPVADIQSVFNQVSKGTCSYGIIPIENSRGGGIGEALDGLANSDVMVCGELYMAIHHNLIAKCRPEQIKKIYSKPEIDRKSVV